MKHVLEVTTPNEREIETARTFEKEARRELTSPASVTPRLAVHRGSKKSVKKYAGAVETRRGASTFKWKG